MLQGTDINIVFFCLFNLMGVYPALYAAIMNPAAKSNNQVHALQLSSKICPND